MPARFVIQPCKLREDRLTPVKGSEPLTLSWKELAKKLAPSANAQALRTLYYVQTGAYVGLLKHPATGQPVNFCFVAQDRSGNVAEVLRRDPSFAHRLIEVFLVKEADRGVRLSEPEGTVNHPAPARRP